MFRSAMSTMLKHPWWLGLTGIITIAALVVAVIQVLRPSPTPPSAPSPDITGEITGDCNAIGTSNDVSCNIKVYPPAPASIGDVKIGWAGYVTFLFEGTPNTLPTPPNYHPSEVRSHCDEWDGWLSTHHQIYTMQPQVWMSLLSGQNDQVVVTRVESTVFTKKPANTPFTIIQCQYGADGIAGSVIEIDIGTGQAHLVDHNKDVPTSNPMPPAALALNGAGYDGAIVRLKSSGGFLYTGRLTVTALINGKERKIDFGTPEKPFRWLGGEPDSYPHMQNDTRYDWNPKKQQWVADLDVQEVYPG